MAVKSLIRLVFETQVGNVANQLHCFRMAGLTFNKKMQGQLCARKFSPFSQFSYVDHSKLREDTTNKLAKLGNAIAISKSETMNHSLTDPLTGDIAS